MKVMLTLSFDGQRQTFVAATLDCLSALVAAGTASHAALDVRFDKRDLEGFGEELMKDVDERAVISLWDIEAGPALRLELPPSCRVVGAYQVEEVVKKDYTRDWPSGVQSPGFKMIALLHRKPGLSHQAFSDHWRNNHGPLAVARQPGFWHYVQNHINGAPIAGAPDWDGIGEIHYRSFDDALNRSYDSEEGQRLIWEDVERFLDYGSSPTLVTHEWVVVP